MRPVMFGASGGMSVSDYINTIIKIKLMQWLTQESIKSTDSVWLLWPDRSSDLMPSTGELGSDLVNFIPGDTEL